MVGDDDAWTWLQGGLLGGLTGRIFTHHLINVQNCKCFNMQRVALRITFLLQVHILVVSLKQFLKVQWLSDEALACARGLGPRRDRLLMLHLRLLLLTLLGLLLKQALNYWLRRGLLSNFRRGPPILNKQFSVVVSCLLRRRCRRTSNTRLLRWFAGWWCLIPILSDFDDLFVCGAWEEQRARFTLLVPAACRS